MMRNLVILKDKTMFICDWFNVRLNWTDAYYCVVDLDYEYITYDGVNWKKIRAFNLKQN